MAEGAPGDGYEQVITFDEVMARLHEAEAYGWNNNGGSLSGAPLETAVAHDELFLWRRGDDMDNDDQRDIEQNAGLLSDDGHMASGYRVERRPNSTRWFIVREAGPIDRTFLRVLDSLISTSLRIEDEIRQARGSDFYLY